MSNINLNAPKLFELNYWSQPGPPSPGGKSGMTNTSQIIFLSPPLFFSSFFYHQFIIMANVEYEMAFEKTRQNCKIYSIGYHFVESIWRR